MKWQTEIFTADGFRELTIPTWAPSHVIFETSGSWSTKSMPKLNAIQGDVRQIDVSPSVEEKATADRRKPFESLRLVFMLVEEKAN